MHFFINPSHFEIIIDLHVVVIGEVWGYLCSAQKGWKSRVPSWSLLAWGGGGTQVFLWFLLEEGTYYPDDFHLARLWFLVLWLRELVFVLIVFIYAYWNFWIASFFSSQCGIQKVKRKPRELTIMHSLGLLSTFQFSYVWFIYKVQGF